MNNIALADAELYDALQAINRAASHLSFTQGKSIALNAAASVQLARGLIEATNGPSTDIEQHLARIEEIIQWPTSDGSCSEQPELF